MGIDASFDQLPMIGAWFTNPDEVHRQQQYHNMALAYGAYRPELANSYQNAFAQAQTLGAPYQGAMAEMYGPAATTDFTAANQNPMSPRQMAIGSPNDALGSTTPTFFGLGGPDPNLHPFGAPTITAAPVGGSIPAGAPPPSNDYAAALRTQLDEQRMRGPGGG